MKKTLALILLICISALLFVVPSGATGEVFVAAGNTVLPLTNAMPIYSSGVWYIDYQCFTKGGLNVSSSYNATEGILVLYNWDTTLIFDLKKTTAYTAVERVPYKAVSFVSSGTVFVPVQFTSQMLGLDYTFFSNLNMIRIKRSSDIPNNMFVYIAQSEIPRILEEYNAEKKNQGANSSHQDSSQNNQSEEDTRKKNIRLSFNITNGTNMKKILDALSRYNFHATFFIQGSSIPACENEIRRAVVLGHSLGMLSENGNKDFSKPAEELEAALSRTNELLFEIAKTKTRLVRIPDGSKTLSKENTELLISLGYRIWDDTATPSGSTASKLYNSAATILKNYEKSTATITLDDSDISLNALSRILRYMNTNNYRTFTISVLDTPVNDINEKR